MTICLDIAKKMAILNFIFYPFNIPLCWTGLQFNAHCFTFYIVKFIVFIIDNRRASVRVVLVLQKLINSIKRTIFQCVMFILHHFIQVRISYSVSHVRSKLLSNCGKETWKSLSMYIACMCLCMYTRRQ